MAKPRETYCFTSRSLNSICQDIKKIVATLSHKDSAVFRITSVSSIGYENFKKALGTELNGRKLEFALSKTGTMTIRV